MKFRAYCQSVQPQLVILYLVGYGYFFSARPWSMFQTCIFEFNFRMHPFLGNMFTLLGSYFQLLLMNALFATSLFAHLLTLEC